MYAKSRRIVQGHIHLGVKVDFIIECKITPRMELFEQQYFTEQYIILRELKKDMRRNKLT